MSDLLAELARQETPYPFDTNELRSPVSRDAVVPEALRSLYAVCDGVSLPDVWNAYFIDPADELVSNKKRGLPIQIAGTPPIEIEPFGSDGGGGIFAVTTDGAVYYLPSWGVVENNVYIGDDTRGARRISNSVIGFLQRLLADVEAFVHSREGHVYIESEFTTHKR
jgi:hypothetical protein